MTVESMLQVEPLEIRSHNDNQVQASNKQRGRKQPYEGHHPHHHHHHRRVHAPAKHPEPEIAIDACLTPDVNYDSPESNPNDPFEKHFLAAASLPPKPKDPKIRASSFRNDKAKPVVVKREQENLSSSGNYSSSPNLLFPKDDSQLDVSRSGDQRGDAPLRRVRSFKSTKGGVVNRGDSFRKKSSHRNLAPGAINDSPNLGGHAPSHPYEFECTPRAEAPQSSYFRVQVIGAPGCGKTSITNQFMSSDYANAFDSMNVDEVERTVTIQLDGEETTMEFIDVLPEEDTDDDEIDVTADAFVVVYSVIDKSTFDSAVQALYKLRHGMGTDRPIILVGNKIDLVRKRRVKRDDVLSISRTYDCLHFETSAALNHHVDELLVAILKQIRHKLNPNVHPSPEINEPEMKKRDQKGGFLGRLYRRLSRKGRPKSKK